MLTMGDNNFVSVLFVVLMLLDSGQKMTMGQNDNGDMFSDVMKDPRKASMVRKMAMSSMSMVREQDMMFLKAGVDTMDKTSTTAMKAMFTNTKERARQMGEIGRSRNLLLDELSDLFNVPKRQMANSVNRLLDELGVHEVSSRNLGTKDDNCDQSDSIRCDSAGKFRTMDGTCNNIRKPIWGASFIPYRRFLKPQYDDDVSSPRMTSRSGEELPSARIVSLVVHESDRRASQAAGASHMLMQWGQFLDHDITSTPIASGAGGSSARCCQGNFNVNPEHRDICFPIKLPDNDPKFGQKGCLNFVRSIQIKNTECQEAPTEQMNQITAFIDGSMVYGSSDDEMRELRTFTGGLLKTSHNDLLPESEQPTCLKAKRTDFCFKAGDARVNEQMGLATLHIIWMREHNRMARELSHINPNWSDDKLFHETRKILGAKLQHITYNEFLPILLSSSFRSQFNIIPNQRGFENSYNQTADPSIRNAFAAAAFRFGHSMVRSRFSQLDHNFRKMEDLRLQSSFGNTSHLIDGDGDGVNRYIRGLVTDKANNIDRFMSPQVTQHLFEDRAGNSLDLAALNIQRGRDHGLPGYNEWRKWCNLPVARRFTRSRDGLIHHPPHAVTRLRRIYNHPDDIDLFSGGISEKSVRGSLVGQTFSCILAHQFKALKIGDRFWYERNNIDTGFTANQLNVIKQTTLAQVLCDNTDIRFMQPNAFRTVSRRNRRRRCEELTQAAMNPWSEDPEIRNDGFRGNNGFGLDNDSGVFNNRNRGNADDNNDEVDTVDNNGFGNGDDVGNGNNNFNNRNTGNGGNENDDFTNDGNGNSDFGNGSGVFGNGGNGNGDFGNDGNGNDVFGNGGNGNGDFGNGGNGNGDFGNGGNRNDDFGNRGNGNDDFGNGRNGNGDFGNGGNGNGNFGNGGNGNAGNANNDFGNDGNRNNDFGNVGNGNGDFGNVGNGNDDFANGGNGNDDFANGGNGNEDFGNGGNGNGDFGNGGNGNGNGDFENVGNGNGGFGKGGNGNNDFGNGGFGNGGNGNDHFENGGNGNDDFGNGGFGNGGNGNDHFENGGNGNDDFGNGNNDFGNGNNDFGKEGNQNNDFGNVGNGNDDFINGNFGNGEDFSNGGNGNSALGNGNDDLGNGNDDFGNGGDANDDFGNGGNGNDDFGNGVFGNNRNGNGDKNGNGNDGFETINGDFDNVNEGNIDINNRNNGKHKLDNGNADFRSNNGGRSTVISSWGQWSSCIRGRNTRKRICPRGARCPVLRIQHKT